MRIRIDLKFWIRKPMPIRNNGLFRPPLRICLLPRKHLRQLHPEQNILIRSGGPPMRAEEVTARAGQGLDLATLVTPRLLLPKVFAAVTHSVILF